MIFKPIMTSGKHFCIISSDSDLSNHSDHLDQYDWTNKTLVAWESLGN